MYYAVLPGLSLIQVYDGTHTEQIHDTPEQVASLMQGTETDVLAMSVVNMGVDHFIMSSFYLFDILYGLTSKHLTLNV